VHLPLFDAGRLKAEYRGATADLDTAVSQYNETVLRAVQETADALSTVDSLAPQRADQRAALDDAQAAYALAEQRYRAGLTDYLTVLSVETALLAAERGLIDIDATTTTERVHLLVSVGGSFTPPSALPPLATSPVTSSPETQP
jgi:outer membrane protein TolC